MEKKKIFFAVSIVLVLFSILSTFIFGAKLDIQFKGGTLITYLYDGSFDTAQFEADAKEALGGLDLDVSTGTDFNTGRNSVKVSLISNAGLTAEKQIALTDALETKYAENNIELLESTDVSPSAGSEFFKKCLMAAALSAIVLIIYIAVRFRNIGGWLAGVCAIIALLHDIIITYGAFVVMGMEIDANFMAVILTILGYSVNDTIVVYDRIRENKTLYKGSISLSDLTDLSINQSLTRSINTSVTTIFAMIVVSLVASMRGVESILSFSLPMLVGLIIGTYSSLFLASPLWVVLESRRSAGKEEEGSNKKKKK
ncbi:MAG: protein translocase subunit SecF [Oscillospiraceae bacterium]|nr:protein translocase subunit SecF [Oscillospiraceae bacterium]